MNQQKDNTSLAIISGVFAIFAGGCLAVFSDPPIFVKFFMIVGLIISGIIFLHTLFTYFRPRALLELPVEIKQQREIREGSDEGSCIPFECEVSNGLNAGVELRVEYQYFYSSDAVNYTRNESVFGTLFVSEEKNQTARLIECIRELPERDFGRAAGFVLKKIKLKCADAEITMSIKLLRPHQRIVMIFSLEGYKPLRKTIWLNSKGQIFSTRPETWPNEDEKTDLLA